MPKAKVKPYLWLARDVARAGPHMTLVRSEAAYEHAIAHLNVKRPNVWVDDEDGGATTHVLTNDENEMTCVIAISVTDQDGIQIAALLAHEATHVAQYHFEHIGERKPAIEQMAYAVQYLTQTLMYEYLRQINEEFPK